MTDWELTNSNFTFEVVSSLFAIFGTFGNLTTILAIIWSNTLKKSPLNTIIVNMSLADLIVSGFVNSFTVVGSQLGHVFFSDKEVLCEFIASICLISCVSSLMNLGLIAFNRYIQICYTRSLYDKIFTFKKTVVWCFLCWVIGVLVDLPNFFHVLGWGKHSYDNKTQNCMWDRKANYYYTLFFPITTIFLPSSLIAFFYAKIFLIVLQTKSRVRRNAFSSSVQISKGMFLSYLIFVICWFPYGLLVIIDFQDRLEKEVYKWLMQSAHANSTFNPILFYYFNSNIEKIFNNFFRRILIERNPFINHQRRTHGSALKEIYFS